MRYLHAYKINNKIIGKEILSWNRDELSGNKPYKISYNSSEAGYSNISSIENWDKHYSEIDINVQEVRNEIKLLVNSIGYSNLTEVQKKIVAKWFISDETEINKYLTEEEKTFYSKEFKKQLNKIISVSNIKYEFEDIDTSTPYLSGGFDFMYNSSNKDCIIYEDNLTLDVFEGSDLFYELVDNVLIIKQAGDYIINVDVSFKSLNSNNLGGSMWLELNGIEIAGTKSYFYVQHNSGDTATTRAKINLEAGDQISIVYQKDINNNNKDFKQCSNGTRLLIWKK